MHRTVVPLCAQGPHLPMTEEEFLKWIDDIDADGDHQVSKQELKKALHDLGISFISWKAWRAMRRSDLNHNRHIDGQKEVRKLIDCARGWGIVR
ncbi:hypothetical protein QJS04_geneDACA017223 [Acorus gramineus]|uniref:EF-hand domain-containing protein n=1 Tax=Acorus gramineus TaxID=55184 RepID=A0AAV8ZZX4_ACOGR|nr:hypothetical protein QJS04_geneDACA017223 [Acorus gramineus]